jgi:hypothetical protein
MLIQVQLKDLIVNNNACQSLGLNPYCVNEGADGDIWYTIKLEDAYKWNLLPNINQK